MYVKLNYMTFLVDIVLRKFVYRNGRVLYIPLMAVVVVVPSFSSHNFCLFNVENNIILFCIESSILKIFLIYNDSAQRGATAVVYYFSGLFSIG